MQIYEVGGAIRDELLGLAVADRDFVVVGATPEQMLVQGFIAVGRYFPVFLHPVTHQEYALARTERKSGRGYKGFVVQADPSVTLEQDLARRDFTVNAIARDVDGVLFDPYHGQQDLVERVFRHVSMAFVEDPVRILRAARFLARFTTFKLAPETHALMREMVKNGEVDHLVAERVWQELARGLMAEQPSRMFDILRDCGALQRILPEIDALFGVPQPVRYHPEVDTGVHTMLALDSAAHMGMSLEVRFAVLVHDVGKALTPNALLPHHPGHEMGGAKLVSVLCSRLKLPSDVRELAMTVTRWHGEVHRVGHMRAEEQVGLLEALDAFRREQRFESVLSACLADARGRPGHEQDEYLQAEILRNVLKWAKKVDAADVVRSSHGVDVPARLRAARVAAVQHASCR